MLKIMKGSNEWEDCLKKFSNHVFWKYRYYLLYKDEGVPEAVYYEDDRGIVFYPYLKRKINLNELGLNRSESFFDITTAYGFGGPLIDCRDNRDSEALFAAFRVEFDRYCQDSQIVSEFIRFQPFIVDKEIMDKFIDIDVKNMNLYVELDAELSSDDYLKTYKSTNRNRIKKAMNHGVEIVIDEEKKFLDEFIHIYKHTMDRNHANEFYYFNEDYFRELIEYLHSNCVLAHAVHDHNIISTELLLFDESCVYFYLGGTLSDYFNLCPNNLLKHHIILWAKEKGISRYLLGGGYKANDGVYQYKKSFAPKHEIEFLVGKKIHNPSMYSLLCTHAVNLNPSLNTDYFPLYRAN
ncbi:lipid II:glycine glycyltransferase FemX [Paenibacillus terrigena]|uniref:lipid II:glycine glycyltransferase FemX n=1 Tax=Paenibacillus terrigena TaxID=369333 RepID=UPI000364E860|nr:GNAT family N-acetyltransferase [Paenibacillus terrigena]